MELVMYLGNDFIASCPLDKSKITFPGYVGAVKRKLLQEYGTLVDEGSLEPEFFIRKCSPVVHQLSTQHFQLAS